MGLRHLGAAIVNERPPLNAVPGPSTVKQAGGLRQGVRSA
jgi:hypothetical protein